MKKDTLATSLLLIGTFFWGMTFIFIKEGISIINLYTFLTWRFMIAALVLVVIFYKKLKSLDLETIRFGIILGLVLSAGYITQTVGLQYTTASKAAFITGLSVVFVPIFLSIINKKFPSINNIIAVIFAVSGLGLLTLASSLQLNIGDIWVFLCAISFAIYIILVGRYTRIFESIKFTVVQLLTVSVVTGIISLFNDKFEIPKGYTVWQAIIFCSILATSFMYAIQNQFQKFISEIKAAIIFSFEPLFAAVTAYFYLHEEITFKIITGGLLIFIGMIVSELKINL